MEISRYKKQLRNFLIYLVIIVILFLLLELVAPEQDMSPIIFGNGFIEKFLLFLVFWAIGAIIGGVLFGYILSPLFLLVHKKTIGRNMIYGIQENLKSEKLKGMIKALFPALMAINFSLMFYLNESLVNEIVYDFDEGMITEELAKSFKSLIAFLVLLSITVPVAMTLFSPVWFLLDAGIVYSNQENVKKNNLEQPIVGRSVGGWYINLLKGYAGISVIFSYFVFIITILGGIPTEEGGALAIFILILNMALLIPMMFFIAIATLPAIIILDIIKENRINYIRKWAKKFGIREEVKITFETINK